MRRYLLGDLPQEEQERFEERLMADSETFRHLLLVEDELVDQYLDGELAASERVGFENHFLRSPEIQQKLRFSKTLREYAATRPSEGLLADAPPVSVWKSILAKLPTPRAAWAYTLAAVLLVLNVIGGSWTFVRLRTLQADLGRWKAQYQYVVDEGEDLRREVLELNRERQSEREQRRRLEQQVTELRERPIPVGPPPVLPLVLSSVGTTRAGGDMVRIRVPSTYSIVKLTLDMGTNDYDTYEVLLLREGQELLSLGMLKAKEEPERITIDFFVPASILIRSDYEVHLRGLTPGGDAEPVETYTFRVTNP